MSASWLAHFTALFFCADLSSALSTPFPLVPQCRALLNFDSKLIPLTSPPTLFADSSCSEGEGRKGREREAGKGDPKLTFHPSIRTFLSPLSLQVFSPHVTFAPCAIHPLFLSSTFYLSPNFDYSFMLRWPAVSHLKIPYSTNC